MSEDKNTPTSPLFRPEVMASQGSAWLGSIRLGQPVSAWVIAGVALAIATALILFGIFGGITKKARIAGITVASSGSLSITAPQTGVLIKSMVIEGQNVVAGQQLFELSTERHGSTGEISLLVAQQLVTRRQALETERTLRIAQHAEKKRALEQQLINITNEAAQLEQESVLAQRRKALAQQTLQTYQTLQSNGFVSPAQIQQKQEDLIDVEMRASSLNRGKAQLEATRLSLLAERTALANNLANELSQLQRTQASLAQEILENRSRKSNFITAPQAGTVTTITYQAGQSVSEGQPLATLIPQDMQTKTNNTLEVYLYAPSRTAGFVAKNQPVLIRYHAFPYQKFGLQKGLITDVSLTPFAPSELPQNLASTILGNAQQSRIGFTSNEALYRIKVKLERQTINTYGQAIALKPGMTLEADVIQDRRKIWEWVADPVLAVVQR